MLAVQEVPDFVKSCHSRYSYHMNALSFEMKSNEFKECAKNLYDDVFEDKKEIEELKRQGIPKPCTSMIDGVERKIKETISFYRDFKIIMGL